MAVLHPSTLAEAALLADCQLTTTRRSGPGGQHRNKVETAVVLTYTPTGASAEANERRSREANRRQAIRRLRLRLAVEHRTPTNGLTDLWLTRIRGGRIVISAEHADFPALLAEALNHLAECGFDVRSAAERLHVSTTQLVNLLKKSAPALVRLNEERVHRGLRPLK